MGVKPEEEDMGMSPSDQTNKHDVKQKKGGRRTCWAAHKAEGRLNATEIRDAERKHKLPQISVFNNKNKSKINAELLLMAV